MCYHCGIAKCMLSNACDARRICRLCGYARCCDATIVVLLSVCLVTLAMLDTSADFVVTQGVVMRPLWYR